MHSHSVLDRDLDLATRFPLRIVQGPSSAIFVNENRTALASKCCIFNMRCGCNCCRRTVCTRERTKIREFHSRPLSTLRANHFHNQVWLC